MFAFPDFRLPAPRDQIGRGTKKQQIWEGKKIGRRERERGRRKKANDKPEPRIAAENLAFPIAIDSSGIGRSVAQCSKPKDWTGPGEREKENDAVPVLRASAIIDFELEFYVLRTALHSTSVQ